MKRLFLAIIILLSIICFRENKKLNDLKLYKFSTGVVVREEYGGIDYILNAKIVRKYLCILKYILQPFQCMKEETDESEIFL